MNADRPGVLAPPPLLFLLPLATGVLIQRLPVDVGRFAFGTLLMVIAFAFAGWALWSFHRAGTTPNPFGSTTAIVASGPYRLTRNPMYVAMAVMYIGAAWLFGSWIAALLLPVAIAAVHFGVIRREERYLTRKFGASYEEYMRKVRRWL